MKAQTCLLDMQELVRFIHQASTVELLFTIFDVFRRLGLNHSIHMDFFMNINFMKRQHFGGIDFQEG